MRQTRSYRIILRLLPTRQIVLPVRNDFLWLEWEGSQTHGMAYQWLTLRIAADVTYFDIPPSANLAPVIS
ncbi:hypothetical protein JTE90_000886 [Oedothorax gibbosus]|uniref:Uncharacterized protein n=1 Tax=Oedothorax gibbosus TaxID=931172 RepID=A0AAV6VUR6_9ARAC|nr:hypothetical protein JTE90_000886 [Oedothorax gibbosus]